MANQPTHAAGSKGRERVTSDQLKEFRNQVSRGKISRETLQSFLTNEGDPLSRYESGSWFSWRDCEEKYLLDVLAAMEELVVEVQLTEHDLQPYINRQDGLGDLTRLRYWTSPIRSFWPKPCLKLKPANPETELLAERGVFWADFESVQFVTISEAYCGYQTDDPRFAMFGHLFESRNGFLPSPFSVDKKFQAFTEDLFESLKDSDYGYPWKTTEDALYGLAEQRGEVFDEFLKHDWRDKFIVGQDDNLFRALELALWYHWTGQSYRMWQMRNFLTMYHLGNFPQGIYQNKLIVLCADK